MLDLRRLRLLRGSVVEHHHRRGQGAVLQPVRGLLATHRTGEGDRGAPARTSRPPGPAHRPSRPAHRAHRGAAGGDGTSRSRLAQSLNETVGTLRLAAFQTAVLALVPHALTDLEQQHPRLRVECRTRARNRPASPGRRRVRHRPRQGVPRTPTSPPTRDRAPRPAHRRTSAHHPRRMERAVTAQPRVASVRDGTRRHSGPGMGDLGMPTSGVRARGALHLHRPADPPRLVESGLAAALLPDLSGAGDRHDVVTHRLHGRPRRQIFTTVRRGAARHPKVKRPRPPSGRRGSAWLGLRPGQQFLAARANPG